MDDATMAATAPDGSPVGLYSVLPPGPEVELVAGATPPGGAVLDLGCGTGRLADALVARGYDVVGVDESAEMLRHVRAARTVRSAIEGVHLPQRFDTVVLASHLVHGPNRAGLLAAVRRHLKPTGRGLVERYDPEWVRTAAASVSEWGGVRFVLRDIERTGEAAFSAVIEYRWRDHVWTQHFSAEVATDEQVGGWLRDAGLELVAWRSPSWAEVRPGRPPAGSGTAGA